MNIETLISISAQPSDINAQHAYELTSFSPERREQQVISSYMQQMASVIQEFEKWATDENATEINSALEAYRAGYAKRLNAYLASHSRIASQMITGAGGWTARMVERNNRRNEICDRRNSELLEYSQKTLERLRRQYDPVAAANAPIMAGDEDSIERLQAKIDAAKAKQQHMKDRNAALRKGTAQGRGHESWELSNNLANIKRMEARIEEIQRTKAQETQEILVGKIKIVDNTEIMRFQIFFPGKPVSQVRDKLKRHGYRWTPSQGCWQAYRNHNARQLIEDFKTDYKRNDL
jgi:hypothetical protein